MTPEAPSRSADSAPKSGWARWLIDAWRPYALIAIVAFVAHGQVLSFDWVYLDDDALILENREFLSDVSNVPVAFRQHMFASRPNDQKTYYRPLVIVSYLVNYQMGGENSFVYHLTNLLLHAGASLLLFRLLTRLGIARLPALLGASVFAASFFSPAVVAWIPGRNDSLLMIFVVPAVLSYMRFVETRRPVMLVASLVAFGAALFTKEAAVVVAPLLLGYRFLSRPGAETGLRITSGDLLAWGGQFAWLLIWYVTRSGIVDSMSPVFMLRSIAANIPQIIPYLGKVLLPVGLSSYPLGTDQAFWPGIVVLAGFVGLAVASRPKRRESAFLWVFGAAWFIMFLLPTFVLAEPWDQALFFEHRMYVPLVGLLILVTGSDLVARFGRRSEGFAVGVLVIAAYFTVVTIGHGRDFRSPLALWQSAVATSPSSATSHMFLGIQLGKSGDAIEARAAFERAAVLDSDLPLLAHNSGVALFDLGEFAAAAERFRKQSELDPSHAESRFFAGRAYLKLERPSEAVTAFESALAIDSAHRGSLEYLAMVFCRLNRPADVRRYVDRLRASGATLSPDVLRVVSPCLDRE